MCAQKARKMQNEDAREPKMTRLLFRARCQTGIVTQMRTLCLVVDECLCLHQGRIQCDLLCAKDLDTHQILCVSSRIHVHQATGEREIKIDRCKYFQSSTECCKTFASTESCAARRIPRRALDKTSFPLTERPREQVLRFLRQSGHGFRDVHCSVCAEIEADVLGSVRIAQEIRSIA